MKTELKTKKETRGGTRKNSGAKPKYGEKTKTIAFRVPISRVEHVKSMLKTLLDGWAVKQRTTASAMSSGGFGTTHYQNTTKDNIKHKR